MQQDSCLFDLDFKNNFTVHASYLRERVLLRSNTLLFESVPSKFQLID